jgi:hypothetical protein
MSYIRPAPIEAAKMSLLRQLKALIFENASLMGLKSGEYGGRYSIRTSTRMSTERLFEVKKSSELTKPFSQQQNLFAMMDVCIIHNENGQRARKG